MAQTLTAFGTKLVANAAAVAAAMAGGTTTAEATAFGNLLLTLGLFKAEAAPAALRTNDVNVVLG
jgi:hypothetical protein